MIKICTLLALLCSTMMVNAQAVNDEPCTAIVIPVENLGCEPTTTYSWTGATYSAASGLTFCTGSNAKDIWYKVTVPANGELKVAVAMVGNNYNVATELYRGTNCNSLTLLSTEGFPCLFSDPRYNELSRIYKNLPQGSSVYLRVYSFDNAQTAASFKICISNTNQLADEPCSAGFLDVVPSDPLGQACVPSNLFSWTGATLTPAIPNPSCLSSMSPSDIKDVWFKVKVPASGKLSINKNSILSGNGSTFLLAAYSATSCNGTFTEIGCAAYDAPLVWANLNPNSVIYVRMLSWYNNLGGGDVKLCAINNNTVPAINNNSKVGIGIDTPFAKLDVAGTGIFRDKVTAGKDLEVRGDLIVQGNIISKYGSSTIGGGISFDSIAFSNRLGNHISLYGGLGNVPQYGFGIQSGTLQIYSDAAASNIAFGIGNSNSFTERARIINSGANGMSINGRLTLRNGTTDINNTPGVWLNNPANTAQLGFVGTQNSSNIGFFGGPAAWGFVYNVPTGNVGIGNNIPNSPLSFGNALGSKISLFGSGTNNYGFGIQGGLLQIHTDAPAANIAFGSGNSSSFTERARIINQGEYGMTLKGRLQLNTGTQSAGLWMTNIANNQNVVFMGMATDNLTGFFGPGGAGWGLTMNTSNANVGIGLNGGNPAKPLSFPASLGEKILLFPGGAGEVGIGVYGGELRLHCDNPGSKVSFGTQDNAGNFDQTALAQRNGVFAFSILGSLWVNGTTYPSDERFKQNITAISSPLEKLLQLNGVDYEMKTDEFAKSYFQPGRQMGLLAQNVEKIVPEAVSEKDGYKGVDYARLVPLLIEAIKELKKEIEILKAKK